MELRNMPEEFVRKEGSVDKAKMFIKLCHNIQKMPSRMLVYMNEAIIETNESKVPDNYGGKIELECYKCGAPNKSMKLFCDHCGSPTADPKNLAKIRK